MTRWNWPKEWPQSLRGYGRRFGDVQAATAISSSIEAGLGSFWGEDPRYIPSGRKGIWPRARYAIKTVFLAQGRDGQLRPAWGRALSRMAMAKSMSGTPPNTK